MSFRIYKKLQDVLQYDPIIESLQAFPIATGASTDHFEESLTAIYNLKTIKTPRLIYYYDLGLTEEQIIYLKTSGLVEYRMFNFTDYPPHVQCLKTYAFKSLVWADMLLTHDVFLWIDASGRFMECFDTVEHIDPTISLLKQNGVVVFHPSPSSIAGVTHPQMYDYLPLDKAQITQRK